MIDKCLDIGAFPEAYPVVERYVRRGIRKRSHRRYLIFYRVTDDRVEIVHVIHASRDYDSIFGE